MIPFDFAWWVWFLIALVLGWLASVVSDTDWGGGPTGWLAGAARLLLIIVAVLCGIAGIAILVGDYW